MQEASKVWSSPGRTRGSLCPQRGPSRGTLLCGRHRPGGPGVDMRVAAWGQNSRHDIFSVELSQRTAGQLRGCLPFSGGKGPSKPSAEFAGVFWVLCKAPPAMGSHLNKETGILGWGRWENMSQEGPRKKMISPMECSGRWEVPGQEVGHFNRHAGGQGSERNSWPWLLPREVVKKGTRPVSHDVRGEGWGAGLLENGRWPWGPDLGDSVCFVFASLSWCGHSRPTLPLASNFRETTPPHFPQDRIFIFFVVPAHRYRFRVGKIPFGYLGAGCAGGRQSQRKHVFPWLMHFSDTPFALKIELALLPKFLICHPPWR